MNPPFASGTAPKYSVKKSTGPENVEATSDLFSTAQAESAVNQLPHKNYELKQFAGVSFFIDLFIVISAFFLMNLVNQGTIVLGERNIKLLLLLVTVWLMISGLFKKFQLEHYLNYRQGLLLITKSSVAMLYSVAVLLVMMGWYSLSRLQTMGTCLTIFLLEAVAFTVFYKTAGKKHAFKIEPSSEQLPQYGQFSMTLFIFDFIALTASFFLLNYFKRDTFTLSPEYEKILIVVYGLWFIVGVFTRKFENRRYSNIYYAIFPYLKSFITLFSMMAILIFTFHLIDFSRLHIFGSLVLFLFMELTFYSIYYVFGFDKRANGDIHSAKEVTRAFKQESLLYRPFKLRTVSNGDIRPVTAKLREEYLSGYKSLFEFINKHINLNAIDEADARVLNTHTLFNIETLGDQSLSLIINLHKINDFRYLNRYFLQVHRKIYNGGYFAGTAHTIDTHRTWFFSKYPYFIAKALYPVDFIFKRIIPKLPGIKKVYFFITRGKNRIISKAETLGRLYFCGFKVIAVTEVDNRLYYIAKCVKNPSIDKNPSYGPIIKLKRVGLDGNIIYIRKFRTMHPYSEYLQDYIFEQNKLNSNGKFNGDFRVTQWGKWIRKLWIDELPQLINFWQGDVNLVGVRALSQHYFNLYPKDLQELRTKIKPGLIPPYYADMPKNFEEIVASERNYLAQKLSKPFVTDVKYFFKSFYNIVFKHARSM